MAIAIDNDAARTMTPRFDEALELVLNEFTGLDTERQYRNAFARLLKPDPLDRVLMMGTDQRDLFVPVLRTTVASSVPPGRPRVGLRRRRRPDFRAHRRRCAGRHHGLFRGT